MADSWARYRPDEPLVELPWRPTAGDTPEGRWLFVDLATRQLIANDPETHLGEAGAFQRDAGAWTRDMPVVWWNPPEEWECRFGSQLRERCHRPESLTVVPRRRTSRPNAAVRARTHARSRRLSCDDIRTRTLERVVET